MRNYRNRRLSFIALGILTGAVACNTDSNSDENNNNDEMPAIGICEYDEQVLAWDEASPEGIVPESLLSFAESEVTNAIGSAVWHDGELRVSSTLQRRGEHAYYQKNVGGGCPSFVEIPVTFSFNTVDSSDFDETIETRARAGGLESAPLVLNAQLEPENLSGEYTPEPPQGANVRGLALRVLFREDGGQGEVNLLTEGTDGQTAWAGQEEQLYWSW